MKRPKRYNRFIFPFLTVMSCVFLVLAYVNFRINRFPEGMVVLAGSIMIMVQAVGALICKKIEDSKDPPAKIQTKESQNQKVEHISNSASAV